MTRAEMKENAKDSLRGKYWETIKMFIVYYLVMFVIGFLIEYFSKLLNIDKGLRDMISDGVDFILTSIFIMGIASYFLKISRNQEVTHKELFSKTSYLIPYVCVVFLTILFTFLWSLLFIIPGLIAAFSYSMVFYILLDNPELNAKQVIKRSKELMNGHKMEYLIFNLSFIGWIILVPFTLGLLMIWLGPYMAVANANFYNSLLLDEEY